MVEKADPRPCHGRYAGRIHLLTSNLPILSLPYLCRNIKRYLYSYQGVVLVLLFIAAIVNRSCFFKSRKIHSKNRSNNTAMDKEFTMNENLEAISREIVEKRHEIAEKITQEQNKKRAKIASLTDELQELRVELVQIYGEAMVMDDEARIARVSEWGQEIGTGCAILGTTLDAMLDEVPQYRIQIGEVIRNKAIELNMSVQEFYEIISRFDSIINQVVYSFSLPFVRYHDEQMKKSQLALLELSVPVVPVAKGVAVLPIIGNIDTHRAKLLMKESLKQSAELHIHHFILDLSGVPVIDTIVAQQIFQIINALRLLGVNTKISGIRPEIAQTIVSLGIDFGKTDTFANLQQALASIGFTYNQSTQ
jgi:rsbT co-antagonist protein RsbR